MEQFAVMARYRYWEQDSEERSSCFFGRFLQQSDRAVLFRLRELHRFAARLEVVEVLWLGNGGRAEPGRAVAGGAARRPSVAHASAGVLNHELSTKFIHSRGHA